MEATFFGNFHLNTLLFRHPYVGIIQIRFGLNGLEVISSFQRVNIRIDKEKI